MRIVLDTNVIVSGLMTPNGIPAKLLYGWIERRFTLVTSPDQLRELARVLTYDKIKKRVDPEDAAAFFENIGKLAERAEARTDITDSPDPDDNLILGTAVAGDANYIVTGDGGHVLMLKKIRGVRIVNPRRALQILGRLQGGTAP